MTDHGFPTGTDTARPQVGGGEALDAERRGAKQPGGSKPGAKKPGIKKPGAKTKIADIVAVCRRCAKRQGLRRGDVRRRLERAAEHAAKQARAAGGAPKGLKIRVVETGCLGPCPKRALAVATGASLAAGRILLLDPEAGEAALAAALLPAHRPPEAAVDREAAAGLSFDAHSCDDRTAESPPPA